MRGAGGTDLPAKPFLLHGCYKPTCARAQPDTASTPRHRANPTVRAGLVASEATRDVTRVALKIRHLHGFASSSLASGTLSSRDCTQPKCWATVFRRPRNE